ncbi:MAG: hypothetical protein J6386_13670 [Candidatus Synoicihabitans palmerolidicus]|nr:hypothetical protein [Candidatus Synoicihabitans palmerolidicus]
MIVFRATAIQRQQPVVLWAMGTDNAQVVRIDSDGSTAHTTIEFGLEFLIALIQAELALHFSSSALNLLLHEEYDWATHPNPC